MCNLWLSNKLYGVDNHANQILPSVTIQDNTSPQTWQTYSNWGHSDHQLIYHLNGHQLTHKSSLHPQSFKDYLLNKNYKAYCHNHQKWYRDLFSKRSSAISSNRLLYQSHSFKQDVKIDGTVKIRLRVKSSRNFGMLSAILLDYGKAKRLTAYPQVITPQGLYLGYQWRKEDLKDFKFQKNPTPYKAITEAHLDLQNRHNYYRVDDLRPNQYVNVNLTFQPTFYHVLSNHRIGLVIYATDFVRTYRGNQKIRYTIPAIPKSLFQSFNSFN